MKGMNERLEILKNNVSETEKRLDLDRTRKELKVLEISMQDPDFWKDTERAQNAMKEADSIKQELNTWDTLRDEIEEIRTFVKTADKDHDHSLQNEISQNVDRLEKRFLKLEFSILLNEPYDKNNSIVAIHAGTGGVDAQDWAQMLLRMILRFCEKKAWSVKIMDESKGNEAGIKSVTLDIKGRYAYGYLKSEAGVHRLVRISPFDAEKMRHTSFALIEVLPEIGEIGEIRIKDEDIEINVYRASGHGGQGVNTTDSAVRIRHKPTGIVVTCQNERSQLQNRQFAMKMLKAKLHKVYEQEKQAEKQKIRGAYSQAEWGNQIRSYVLQPYQLVKDHRTKFETKNPEDVLNGNLDDFIESYLKWKKKKP